MGLATATLLVHALSTREKEALETDAEVTPATLGAELTPATPDHRAAEVNKNNEDYS